MSIDHAIKEQIARYLRGEITASELEDFIAVEAWDIDQEPPETRQLGYDALRFISEAANGEWTDEELRGHLGVLCGIVTYVGGTRSAESASPLMSESLLDAFSEAERRVSRHPVSQEARLSAPMSYAQIGLSKAESSGSGRPTRRESLRQPRAENETPSPELEEAAAG